MAEATSNKKGPVGVIGAGSFGITVAYLLSVPNNVLIYARDPEVVRKINENHRLLEVNLSPRIKAISVPEELATSCEVIFPVIPSEDFRDMMKTFGPLLSPRHILIHGTKGLDTSRVKNIMSFSGRLNRNDICTMSKVIAEESNVLRVGCLSGPNLSKEILEGQPTATVIAS
ncbi:MAG TPA: NAD(P)-binding domain-containing protein, partial [Saprospiraceae bacterium]|nr:NAD(P)-binding domain-containing protein [Saprospiraceae bacterium]